LISPGTSLIGTKNVHYWLNNPRSRARMAFK
jgi:hypothetical protein